MNQTSIIVTQGVCGRPVRLHEWDRNDLHERQVYENRRLEVAQPHLKPVLVKVRKRLS